jgi:hypothetical protein
MIRNNQLLLLSQAAGRVAAAANALERCCWPRHARPWEWL